MDEAITFWWLKMKVAVTSQNTFECNKVSMGSQNMFWNKSGLFGGMIS